MNKNKNVYGQYLKNGEIVEWVKDSNSNIVWKGDRAKYLGSGKFKGISGSVKGEIFYESSDDCICIDKV
ncbi:MULTISPECIES: hypothetical protein [Bacillus]|uniref:Uncharacterized protein n=1 Tax=Bacillus altitudinis TaxID=293387 RepID=A0ABV1S915_BACAB|nr:MULTISPECIES: hypothetical protein [Bacillus]MCY7500220.1 hypothetical protein [Bacillus pumilus]MCY7528456.1 hypothetical protein [Bacillus pumilus]MED4441502.1 hypothetical protein [Bacillus pumilus]MED4490029.1 hypothetical protein [Bacillus pumilus]NOL32991.1 hypothetical protein [Bacillus altitudinis]